MPRDLDREGGQAVVRRRLLTIARLYARRRIPGGLAVLQYLDAGTGSMLVQMVVAGVAGAAVFAKIYWAKVTAPFRRKRPDAVAEPEPHRQPVDD